MFDNLSEKIKKITLKVSNKGSFNEETIKEILKDLRLALLEADVHFKVVSDFTSQIEKKILEQGLDPFSAGKKFEDFIYDQLLEALGKEDVFIDVRKKLSVLFMVGLQGMGKTTSSVKLARYLQKKMNKKCALVSVDVRRPAAKEQLMVLAKSEGLEVFDQDVKTLFGKEAGPDKILTAAKKWAETEDFDVLIVDTAGRLEVEEDLMKELTQLKKIAAPKEVLLVVDSMLGQKAVSVAQSFKEALDLTGLILTKVDGDSKGGAALSIRKTLGLKISFLGVGEKPADFEEFSASRIADRILDKGDLKSLSDKLSEVSDSFSQAKAEKMSERMFKGQLTLEDFLEQLKMLQKLGGLGSVMGFLPGMKALKGKDLDKDKLKQFEAIIQSMTPKERHSPKVLNGSRRVRIAKGSGTQVSGVNQLVKQFEDMNKMMKKLSSKGLGSLLSGGGLPGGGSSKGPNPFKF